MYRKRLGAIAACALFLTSCAASDIKVSEETTAAENTVLSAEADDIGDAAINDNTEEENKSEDSSQNSPSIYEDYAGFEPLAKRRGNALVKLVDDEAASDGRALMIYNRQEAWNGADYNADLYRGNEIEVTGSFRSANPSVRVSIQFTIYGNTSYNMVFAVDTNDSSYKSGSGKYTIPASAENILVYIESDNLEDIYADDFSIKVCGEYTHYSEAEALKFVDTSDYPSLKDAYAEYFRIGTAISPTSIETPEYSELIKAQFNSVTCENNMKPDSILDHNKTIKDKETYMEAPALRFENFKAELDFARDNGMTVRGHTLVWHSQTPDWIFYKDYEVGGELADRELMLKRMENYIKGVMEWTTENYPGLISAWDVVNEAADDGGGMRESLWYKTIGDDYISKAFEFARKYAPEDAKLFYNDYNSYMTGKQNDIIEFLRPVAEAGNIDGVGMQSHINTDINQMTYIMAMEKYHAELGVEIHVTELDIGTKNRNDGWQTVQGEYYRTYMEKLIELQSIGVPITSVTLWGLSDAVSWRASELPLVFNPDLSRKPAFDGMIAAAQREEQE